MKIKVLKLLMKNKGSYVSGQEISNELNVSRTAIWKHINSLKEEGYEIESASKKGYLLKSIKDKFNLSYIKANLKSKIIGSEILFFDEIESTNDYAKLNANRLKEGSLILTNNQTKGRGRRGKYWNSNQKDSICMSMVLKPNMPPYMAPILTQVAAVAVTEALEKFNISTKIKWPNDIYLNDKKICGILTEMSAELEKINYIILGMGINVSVMSFEEDLKEKATSILKEGFEISKVDLLFEILSSIEKWYLEYERTQNLDTILKICREKSFLIGKDIKIINSNDEVRFAKAIDINQRGNLLVEYEDKKIEELFSADVSVRDLEDKKDVS